MAYSAEILADSLSERGDRLVTVRATYPRYIHAEMLTYRMHSRNSQSSRAEPFKQKLLDVLTDPVVPDTFGKYQSGMSPNESLLLTPRQYIEVVGELIDIRDFTASGLMRAMLGKKVFAEYSESTLGRQFEFDIDRQQRLIDLVALAVALPNFSDEADIARVLGTTLRDIPAIAKQNVNRYLEPFAWHTNIITATEWSNFFAQRIHPDAQREINIAATCIRAAMDSSMPKDVGIGGWHLPYFDPQSPEDAPFAGDVETAKMISTFRCAGVSYMKHGQKNPERDIRQALKLMGDGHMSPLEHVATPMTDDEIGISSFTANFRGWKSFRSQIPNEHDFSLLGDPV
jgi:hypothetical protein